ncbi:hypothetical protein ACMFMF_001714 [Clarireedia jacksonii]
MTRLRWLYGGIAASIFTLTLAADASSTCWYPDGITAEPAHVPCNQTISGASACCDPNDSCTTSEPTGRKPYRTWTALWACSDLGLPLSEFCCGYANGESCCPSKFELGVTGQAFKPGDDQRVKNISAAAIAKYTSTSTIPTVASAVSSVATASSTPSACPDPDLGTKVGLGVGVPLGVLAAGILGWLFWREVNKGKTKNLQPVPGHDVDPRYAAGQQQHLVNQNEYEQTAMKNRRAPPPIPVFEAPPNHLRAELKG